MLSTFRNFNIGLYEEHLEEASFLHGQRAALLASDELPWRGLAPFEDRLEAHLDALVVGGDLALEVCRRRCTEGDAGEAFAAISVFCRHLRPDLVASALTSADGSQFARLDAIADALKENIPPSWIDFVERALLRGEPKLARILAQVAAYRRLPVSGALCCFGAVQGLQSEAVAVALGRLACSDGPGLLRDWLRSKDERVRDAAVLALLRTGACDHLESAKETWAGLAGPRDAAAQLLAQEPRPSPCRLEAVGLAGDPRQIECLLAYLADPGLADAAAWALDTLTGASLHEARFVEAPVNEDELSDRERMAWQENDNPPRRPDGAAYGQMQQQLSTDPVAWGQWLAARRSNFADGRRYRSGLPMSPAVLAGNLTDPRSGRRLREFAAEELAIRYGCPVPFETSMPVARQLRALRGIQQWVEADAERFVAGEWYFAGAVQ